ncbi:MAG: hypothetical protein J5I62_08355 [Flavobacteriales bacterium]|nr:hypothetical protein [Flavobacteriales bacterium]MEB2340395.1 hypothetical protein [Flavobacteriia bacterium]
MRLSLPLILFFWCWAGLTAVRLQAQDLGNLKGQKPVTLHGSLSAGFNYYSTASAGTGNFQGYGFGNSPSYFFQANPVLSIYGLALPMSLLIASQDKQYSLPFNRFGLSPYYKWAKLHLGWRSLNFSQFTLGGQQMLGAGFELTPGKLKASFMYGRFNNAITDISLYNNLNNATPIFLRKGYAARLGYGSTAHFIELSYLQAEDDLHSVKGIALDSLPAMPAANQAAGLKGQVTLRKKLIIHADAGASYYIRNIASPLRETDDPWVRYAVFPPRFSSRIAFAGEAGMRYRMRGGNLRLTYRRIDPDYRSMGAFYMQTDLEQVTAGFDQAFLKRKVFLRADLGLQRNNLYNTAASNSRRTIGNINLNISPSQAFGIGIQYSNHGISQQIIPQLQDPATVVRYDSVLISQVNQSIAISPRLMLNRERPVQHTINMQASMQSLRSGNETYASQEYSSNMGKLTYVTAFTGRKINLSNSLNYFSTRSTGARSATLGYNLGLSKQFLPDTSRAPLINAVTLSLYGGYFATSLNDRPTGHTITANPALTITFLKRHSLQLNANHTASRNKSAAITQRNQLTFSARYNLSF